MAQYLLGLYEKALPGELTWEEKLRAAGESGFDFVEMSIDETDAKLARLDMNRGERRAVLAAMDAAGVPLRSICLSGHRKYPLGSRDPAVRARSLEILEKAVDLAWDLGIRIIQLAGYDVYYEEGGADTRALFEENLARCVELAARRGVVLGFETMETPFMDTVAKAMEYVRKVDSPYLGIYPDTGNLTNAALLTGVPVPRDLALGKGHIFAAHLKETKPGVYRELAFGAGHTDYLACARALRDQGVRLFTGEFWHDGSPRWRENTAAAAAFLRERLDLVFAKT